MLARIFWENDDISMFFVLIMLVEICVLFLIASTKDKSYNKNNKIQVRASEWQIKNSWRRRNF
ncbi:hypothetical protein B5G19_01390 [Enterococcus cecorum]|nr:hypothetical protein B5G19_01390 [Enterococcus cecorum]